MKASDTPEISKKWWTSEKPNDIEGKDLVKALDAAEKSLEVADKKGDEDAIDSCLATLKSLNSTVDKTIKKECDKKKHKDVITVLEKFEDLIGGEVERLNDAKAALSEGADKDGEDDEDSKGKLFEPDYLVKMIKLLKTGKELSFSFGLDKESPESSCLILCRKRTPDRLYKMMKSKTEFSKRLMTFGRALGEGKMLQFTLADNAKEPAQIVKTAKKYLRKNPELKFKKLRVICGGVNYDEDMEGEDADKGQVEAPHVAEGNQQQQPQSPQAKVGEEEAAEDRRKQFKEARKRWVSVRSKAEQDLEKVKDGIRDYYLSDSEQFPIAMKKLKELDDIMDNLSDDLRDALDAYASTPLKQKDRLHEYGENARKILDGFTDYVDKSPLLAAIDQKEFADVQIKTPMAAAMRDLAKTIG
jgi:hypothetical protein